MQQHEFETTRLAVFIEICVFQISINNTQINGKIHVNMTRLVALRGQFLCVYLLLTIITDTSLLITETIKMLNLLLTAKTFYS